MTHIAIDTEYDEITKVPFIVTMSDGESSTLLYPDDPRDYHRIKKICESDCEKVFHSATSDIYALSQVGIHVSLPYDDTFIVSSIVDENFSSRRLKDLAKRYLKEPCKEQAALKKEIRKYKKLLGKEFRWSKIPKEVIEPYAIKDAEYTIAIWDYYQKKLKPYRELYEMELRLIPIIVRMEQRGFNIDRSFCLRQANKMTEIYKFYYNKLIRLVGCVPNFQSPKQLAKILPLTGIPFTEKTPTGKLKTGKEVLEKYSDDPIIHAILMCRNALKQRDTYYLPLREEFTSDESSIAHFSFWQSGTKTGRFSAEMIQLIPNPLDQTKAEVPNEVRRAFIPRPGYVNVYLDYDQIEMKLFAHFTNNRFILEAMRNGMDAHDVTAQLLYEIIHGEGSWETADESEHKAWRKIAKRINFGVIYGMGTAKLAVSLGVAKVLANKLLSNYEQKYRVRKYIGEMTSLLFRQGFIRLDWIGREYRVPRDLAYKCVNIQIQGSAAYVIKLAMLRIDDYIKKSFGYFNGVNILGQIHDELVIEIHESLPILKIINRIKNIMEDRKTFQVPITASVKWSTISWADKKELKEAA